MFVLLYRPSLFIYPFRSQNFVELHWKRRTIVNFGMAALSHKNHPRILRSGQSALGCGGRSFDVAFIYPFSIYSKKSKKVRIE